ncbi:thymidine phosphorylase, partial [Candidatus Magnetobacterium casensis]
LAHHFIELGKKLGIKVSCVSTFGEQPVGRAMGPALEAREALNTLLTGRGPVDLIEKASIVAGMLFEFKGFKNPQQMASDIITSGKAGKKLKQIIAAQGGNPNIKPEDIPIGPCVAKLKAACSGKVWWISNHALVHICREAGAPKAKGAGVYLYKKVGDAVKKGDVLMEIYSENTFKLNRALNAASQHYIIGIGDKYDMMLARIPEEKYAKRFILER